MRRPLVFPVVAMLLVGFTVPASAGVKIVEIRYDRMVWIRRQMIG
jgi:hypothetical protein